MNQSGSSRHQPGGSLTACEMPASDSPALSRRYLLYTPAEDVARPWPLILFLHGAGERGDDLGLVKLQGLPKRLSEGATLPLMVVAPQCPAGQRWAVESLTALLNEVERNQPVDPDRVYVTGMSMGGAGTWALATAHPNRFAAIAPVCGRGDPSAVCAIAHVPVWAFHGARDDVVPLSESEVMVEALRRCGADVLFTVYPEAGHDSWTETYANPELYAWFLQHRRAT
jgi:predicted peptidase